MCSPEDSGREGAWRLVRYVSEVFPPTERIGVLGEIEDALRILDEYDAIGIDRVLSVCRGAIRDILTPAGEDEAIAVTCRAMTAIVHHRERYVGVHATRTRRAARAAWRDLRAIRETADRYGWADTRVPAEA